MPVGRPDPELIRALEEDVGIPLDIAPMQRYLSARPGPIPRDEPTDPRAREPIAGKLSRVDKVNRAADAVTSKLAHFTGPHLSQGVRNLLHLSPMAAGSEALQMTTDAMDDVSRGRYAEAARAPGWIGLAAMGAVPGAGALGQARKAWSRPTVSPLKQWRRPGTPEEHIRAFHGSPHEFERFSMEKIGTGEGAQAYGHGMYFAESPGVAKSYREGLSNLKVGDDAFDPTNSQHQAAVMLRDSKDRGLASERLRHLSKVTDTAEESKAYSEAADLIDKGDKFAPVRPGGATYEVAIKGKPEEFLDWDAPLGQQPKKVREKLQPILELHRQRLKQGLPEGAEPTGSHLVSLLEQHGGKQFASDEIRESGIKGIRYRDAMSRKQRPTYKGKAVDRDDVDGFSLAQRGIVKLMEEQNETAKGALDLAKQTLGRSLADARLTHDRTTYFPGMDLPQERATARQIQEALDEVQKMKASDWGMERGTYNYVVMNEETIEILSKYGLAGLIGAGAAARMATGDEETFTGA